MADPKDAEIARLTAANSALKGSLTVLDEGYRRVEAERDEARTDLGRIIMSLPTGKGERAAGAVEGVRKMRARLEAERDAALAREAALLASNQTNRDLLYQLTGAQSEVTHLRNRFDTAVATARAEGRKEGLREAAALCDDTANEALEESGAESRTLWTWFRGQRDAILAAAEKETIND